MTSFKIAREVIVIDAGVSDWKTLIAGLSPDIPVILLPADGNGLEGLVAALSEYGALDALHLVSHGGAGRLNLGDLRLTSANLGEQTTALAAVARHLTSDSDVLIYGCSVAAGEGGQVFVQDLSAALGGADIAASTDRTGPLVLGGDWDLEYAAGEIETVLPFTVQGMQGIDQCLGCVNGVTTTSGRDPCGSPTPPPVTGNYISISGASGTGGVYKIGDTVTATWDNSPIGDNNAGVFSVKVNFSNFGGGAAVSASSSLDIWTASYTIVAGTIDSSLNPVYVTATYLGTTPSTATGTSTTYASVDNFAATVTDANVSISGATGTGGAYKMGDTVTATWNNTAGGDNNTDTISSATVDFSQFGGGSAVAASDNSGIWTATYTITAGAISATSRNVSVTATDNAGNTTTRADTTNAAVDNQSPTVTSVTVPTNSTYSAAQNLDFTVNFSEAVTVDITSGTPRIALTIGATTQYATYLSGSGSSALVFRYTVQPGDTDADGIAVGSLGLNSGTLNDAAGNAATLTLNSVGATTGVLVSAPASAAPVVSNLNGDSLAWAGVGAAVALDSGTYTTAADAEFGALNFGNGDWSGASLTVARVSGALASDIFGFGQTGYAVNGANLQSGGLTFASFTNTGGTLTISFTSSSTTATTALVNAVVKDITYLNATPSGDATIRFTLSDGTAATTADVTITSDTIYVTNNTDTATIDVSNGVSLSEAVAIAATDGTGNQTLILASNFSTTLAGNLAIGESLIINADAADPTVSGSAITVGSGFTLSFTNATGKTATIASELAGNGNLAKMGAGRLTLSGTNTYTGTTAVTGGSLSISNDSNLGTGAVTLDGGQLTLNGLAGGTVDNAIILEFGGGTVNVSNSAATLSGVISGSGALNKTGGQQLTLTGASTFSGNANVVGGSLVLNNSGGNALADTTEVAVSSGAMLGLLTNETIGVLSGAGDVSLGSSTLTLSRSANSTFSGALSGSGGLSKSSMGTLILSGTNTYSGATNLSAGELSLSGGSAIADSSAVTVASGTTLSLSANETIGSLAGAGAVALGANTLTAGGDGTSTSFSGVISGAGALTKTGAGTLTLSGANTYSGATNVSAGQLTVSSVAGTVLDDASAVTVASGAIFRLIYDETVGSIAGAGSINLNNGVLTVGGDNTNTTFSGVISGGSLVKTGSGTLLLENTGNNVIATVNAGILGGNGKVGTLTVASGATLAPGASAGDLDTGNLTLASGATLAIELGGTTASTQYDQLKVTGTVDITGATLSVSQINSFSANGGNAFTIIDNDAADAVTGTFNGLVEGASITVGGKVFNISYMGGTGNDVVLTTQAPPAPAPAPEPAPAPAPQTSTVDGTTVQTQTTTGGNGSTTTTQTVAPVSNNRPEDPTTPNSGLADIPLATDGNGNALLQVSLPTGVGLSSSSTSGGGLTLREQLINSSSTRVGNTTEMQRIIEDGIDQFVPTVGDPAQVTVRTITLSVATPADGSTPQAPIQPIIIRGTTGTGEQDPANPQRQEALVIDARNLPPGTVLDLSQVEFAIIIGPTTAVGGTGQNYVIGDGSSQFIVLGPEDDNLHGGAGDDTIGSKGGDDQLYGDEGNDLVVGGVGNDRLYGGDGNDILQGGASDAGQWSFKLSVQGELQATFTPNSTQLADSSGIAATGIWTTPSGTGSITDSRFTWVYDDYAVAKDVALLVQSLAGRLPSLVEMGQFASGSHTSAQLADMVHQFWLATSGNADQPVGVQLAAAINQVWGANSATTELVASGVNHLNAGGSWSDIESACDI